MHCQNAHWAIPFLLHKFNITAKDDLVGTDFGKYVKYKRPERRGGKPYLSGKSWRTTHDPWRGISRTAFGLDYLRQYECPKDRVQREHDSPEKMFELNHYDEEDQPRYGWDVYVQRISCYIQHKESTQDVPDFLESPYNQRKPMGESHQYVPQLETLDNNNTIIIFDNSQSGSVEDTLIQARQYWESRWRRLPFYLAYESHNFASEDKMAIECMKIILADVWKSIVTDWETFLDVCSTHLSILEEKIYEQPADESRAPELWMNSNMWLKVERLAACHIAVVKEMQTNLKEFLSEDGVDNPWLDASPGDMEKLRGLIQEDLKEPTNSLADLMYKSVGIRDSRHGLQLNTSMWRLSWITFIFLPLTFISTFFGMNVTPISSNPDIRYYFASAVPMMVLVLIFWYFIKHALARRRQTPYQRGIYEQLFFQLATAYPRLWSRSGPIEQLEPSGRWNKLKWRMILNWNRPERTIRIGSGDDTGYDDLGAWARFKRTLTRRWTSQVRFSDPPTSISSTTLEEGVASDGDYDEKLYGMKPRIVRTSVTGDMKGKVPSQGRLEVPKPETVTVERLEEERHKLERPTSKSSSNRNSGIIVEEEPNDWLEQKYGRRGKGSSRSFGSIVR